jgi:ABC-type nitrate/sulfonate/bicarbonate transport system permease component
MNLLALTLVSHLTVVAFKPLNLWKIVTRTQQIEEVVKPLPVAVAEAFGRAA